MKIGFKLTLILLLNLLLATPTSSVPMTQEMKLITLAPKDYAAYRAVTKYKWGSKQHSCLRALWGKESAWNFQAKSKTHDYGIPQRHMRNNTKAEITDFLKSPNNQIDWGLRYISTRYGSPCAAWQFHLKNNWY